MATAITWGLILMGFLLIAVAAFWSWLLAWEDSPERGAWYLWPPYAWYYVITRWEKMRAPFLLGLAGAALCLLGLAVGHFNAVFPTRGPARGRP